MGGLGGLRPDEERRYWIREQGAEGDVVDIGDKIGQMATEVKIDFPLSHNTLNVTLME